MKYILPFGLTQKPLNHYVEHGVIRFNVKEGVLRYTVRQITKQSNGIVINGIVKDKTQLDQLLTTKNLNDVIQTLEVVN